MIFTYKLMTAKMNINKEDFSIFKLPGGTSFSMKNVEDGKALPPVIVKSQSILNSRSKFKLDEHWGYVLYETPF